MLNSYFQLFINLPSSGTEIVHRIRVIVCWHVRPRIHVCLSRSIQKNFSVDGKIVKFPVNPWKPNELPMKELS